MRIHTFALVATSLIAACDSTVFGDAEPDLDNPFTEGTSEAVEAAELASPVALIASQRWPGTLYAIADENASVIYALDDSGKSQGQISIEDLPRGVWRDLAINNEQLLILDVASAQLLVHHINEPDTPPPFDAVSSRLSTQVISVAELSLPDCRSLVTANSGSDGRLLCNEADLYSFELNNGDGNIAIASATGVFDNLPSTALDFSISPAGQFGLLTFEDGVRVAQSASQDWLAAFAGGGSAASFDSEDFEVSSSAFAFNGILLHSLGKDQDSGRIFSIFNP